MPRRARRLSESRVYHVIIRGNERQKIFKHVEDKKRFIETLRLKRKELHYEYLAYCLMDNHVHLIIDQGGADIGKVMQGINVRYVYYFNKKYNRIGHLFQDRFKSEVIEDERYLLAAIRYVHNNPVKAGMVAQPADYVWSSYNSYLSPQEEWPIVDRKRVLSMFAEEESSAINLFAEFSMMDSEEMFIDVIEETVSKKTSIQNEEQARIFVESYLQKRHIDREALKKEKLVRNELIVQLKNQSDMSVREISELLGVDRNIVQRAK